MEPYVLAADVHGAPTWTGRGGWTWYTAEAGWAYRSGIEMAGIRLVAIARANEWGRRCGCGEIVSAAVPTGK